MKFKSLYRHPYFFKGINALVFSLAVTGICYLWPSESSPNINYNHPPHPLEKIVNSTNITNNKDISEYRR